MAEMNKPSRLIPCVTLATATLLSIAGVALVFIGQSHPVKFSGILLIFTSFAIAIAFLRKNKPIEYPDKEQDHFGQIYNSNMIGIALCRETGQIDDANDAFLNIVGYTREDLKAGNVNWVKMTPPDQIHLSREGIEEARAKSKITPFEKEYIRKDGSRVSVLMGGASIAGHNDRGIAYAIDITEQKRAEEVLQDREQTIRALVETSKDWIWAIDVNGKHTYSNAAIESILGYSVKELVDTKSFDLMHPDDRKKIKIFLPERVRQKQGWRSLLIRWEHKDGNYRYLESNAEPILDAKGVLTGFRGVDRDVTERLQAEKELKDNEERMRLLFESVPHAVYECNLDGVITVANYAYAKITGFPTDRVIGMHIWDLMEPGQQKDSLPEYLQQLIAEQPVPTPYECRNITRGGRIIDIEVNWDYKRNQEGNVTGFVCVLSDTTERKRIDEKIERLSRLPSENPNPVLRISNEGEILYANQASRDVLDTWQRSVGEHLPSDCLQRLKNVIESDTVSEFEFECANGRLFSATLAPFKDGGYVNVYGLDITERKTAENKLHESRERLSSVLGSISDGFFAIDKDMIVTYFNKAAEDSLKMKQQDVLGHHLFDEAFPDAKGSIFEEKYTWAMKENQPVSFEAFFDHEPIRNWYSVRAYPFKDGLTVYFQVITSRKEAEESLKRNQYYLEKAQEIGSIGSWDLDVKENELTWTAENYRIFGLPVHSELTYESFLSCVHPDDREYVDRKWSAAMNGQPYDIEHRLIVDGEIKWVREKAEMQFDDEGNCIRGTGFTQDITERKIAKEKIETLAKFPAENPNPVARFGKDGTMIFGNRSSVPLQNALDCRQGEKLHGQWLATVVKALNFGNLQHRELEYEDHTFSLTFAPVVEFGYVNVYGHDITDLRQAEKALQWESSVNKALAHLSNVLNKPYYSFEEISDIVLAHAQRLTGSSFGYVGYIDEQTGYMVAPTLAKVVWKKCQIPNKTIVFKKPVGLWGWVIKEQESVLVNSPADDPRTAGTPQGHIPIERFVGAPSLTGDDVVGMVAVANPNRDYTDRDLRLIERLAEVYALAIQANRSQQKLLENQKQLRDLVYNLGLTEERRRRRVAKGMNEELIGPMCFVENRVTSMLENRTDTDGAMPQVRRAISDLLETTRSYVSQLSFPVLGELGFEKAVERWLCEEIAAKHDIETVFENDSCCETLDDDMKFFLFEAIRELLANTVQHAHARTVKVSLTSDDASVQVTVADDGIGLDEIEANNAPRRAGYSLFAIRERLRHMGGDITIESQIGKGTKVLLSIPLEKATAE